MNIICAIQSNGINYHKAKILYESALIAGCQVQEVVLDQDTKELMYPLPPLNGFVIPLGSIALRDLAYSKGWDGVFFNLTTFRVDQYMKYYKHHMLNYDMQNYDNLTADIVKHISESYNGKIHIRPVKDSKAFTGTVIAIDSLHDLVDKIDCEISVSSVKNILAEYRFFIVGGKVISGSSYRVNDENNVNGVVSDDLYSFVQQMCDIWLPHENVVMDVANTDNGYKIVELNCFNCSGIYKNDMVKVFSSLKEII